jgi:phage host-nuclease inhibitor protein Gam
MTDIEHLRQILDERTQRLEQALTDQARLLDERYGTQTKALDAAFVAAEKAVATALESAKEAVAKAEAAAERRFESVNEFRAQLSDQAGQFVTKAEYGEKIEALGEQISELKEARDRAAGNARGVSASRAALFATGGLIVAIVGAVVTILALNS